MPATAFLIDRSPSRAFQPTQTGSTAISAPRPRALVRASATARGAHRYRITDNGLRPLLPSRHSATPGSCTSRDELERVNWIFVTNWTTRCRGDVGPVCSLSLSLVAAADIWAADERVTNAIAAPHSRKSRFVPRPLVLLKSKAFFWR